MVVGQKLWKELFSLFSIEGQSTKAVLADMYGCIFQSSSV
jgi:hypothetical protein